MALHIEDPEIVAEIEAQSLAEGIPPEEVVRLALAERRGRVKAKRDAMLGVLEKEVWPSIPPEILGRTITKAQEEAMLGYGSGEY